MKYKIYKMSFRGAVHLGRQSIEDGEYTFCADTLFSALCQEAVHAGVLEQFYQYTKAGQLRLSDAFPYIGDCYYLPKPMKRIETEDRQGNSVIKKAYKKLKYIPMEDMGTYLSGEFDVLNAPGMSSLGSFEMKMSVSIRGEEKSNPYRVGTYYYHEGNGLYVIAGYGNEEVLRLADQLFAGLSYSGIGGRRASGMGRFTVQSERLPLDMERRLTEEGSCYMSLSLSLPSKEEIEGALQGAEYLLQKRSGFVASADYAGEQMRKKDLYVLKAGSCFRTRYEGDVYDVSQEYGRHPVYRYAKSMLMKVDA